MTIPIEDISMYYYIFYYILAILNFAFLASSKTEVYKFLLKSYECMGFG